MATEPQWTVTGPSSVDEGNPATYTVTYGDHTLGGGETVSVSVSTTDSLDDAATPAVDYTALNTTLTFTAGGVTAKTVVVSTIADSIAEGTEDFRVILSAPSAGVLTVPSVDTSIVDDEYVAGSGGAFIFRRRRRWTPR